MRRGLLTVVERAGVLSVAVVNDTDEPFDGTLALSRQKFDGAVLAVASLPVAVGPRAVQVLALPADVASADDERREALIGVTR